MVQQNPTSLSGLARASSVLLQKYDEVLMRHGDTARGAHWPNEADRKVRLEVMLGIIETPATEPVVICDLGCGTGNLLGYLLEHGLDQIRYIGVDRSAIALRYARAKYPDASFIEVDVNNPGVDLTELSCDYLIANGLFTVKWDLSHTEMWNFMEETIRRVWPIARRGIAFNVMSKAVDWERDDLFHVSMDQLSDFLHGLAGRHLCLRADYGLYEYTAYAFRPRPQFGLAAQYQVSPRRSATGRSWSCIRDYAR